MTSKTVVVVGRSVNRIKEIDDLEAIRFHVYTLMLSTKINNVMRYEIDAAFGLGIHQAKIEAGGVFAVYQDSEMLEGAVNYNELQSGMRIIHVDKYERQISIYAVR